MEAIQENDIIETDEDTKDMDGYADGAIYPHNMPKEVDIREEHLTIFEWKRRLTRELLITDPEFQRNLVWKSAQKSRFIESILLNIPLPPLYVNQTQNGKYIIVDGLQRTTTMADFLDDRFALSDDLTVLTELCGYKFSGLTQYLQTKIEDKQLLIYLIKPSVPLPMIYDIFERINTGGTQLTRQEVRNCIFLGPATRLLKELAEKPYFKRAIDKGISPKRMKDREAILRYLAFKVLGYEPAYKDDMDDFLERALKTIQQMSEVDITALKNDFERVMRLSYQFFGDRNFRLPTTSSRGRINIALLEAVSYFFSIQSDEFLRDHKQTIVANYEKLLQTPEFIDTVRFSTGDTRRVRNRFKLVQEILGDVEC
ncbi:MAG TPA: DUF262 domain-containing protein [Anaerolineae bacterium]|nr:DUF262 domain-containing protein [Anaerolineae bacterium]